MDPTALLKLKTGDGNRERGVAKQNILSHACKKIFKCTQNSIMHFQSSLKFAYLTVKILKNKFLSIPKHIKKKPKAKTNC